MKISRHRRSLVEAQADELQIWLEHITEVTKKEISSLRARRNPNTIHVSADNEKMRWEEKLEFVQEFMKAELVNDPGDRITTTELNERYADWITEGGPLDPRYVKAERLNMLYPREFGLYLHKAGVKSSHSRNTRYWNVGLRKLEDTL